MAHDRLLPGLLPIAELEAACRQETQQHRDGEASDTSYCLEIFNRALRAVAVADGSPDASRLGAAAGHEASAFGDDSQEAYAALVRIYGPYVRSQLLRFATPTASLEDFEQQVWLRFWHAAQHGLTFVSLLAALRYLSRTAASVRIEAQQQFWRRQREHFVQADASNGIQPAVSAADPFDRFVQQRVRDRIYELLRDPLEYRIFRMRYDLGFPPREIAQRLAGEGVGLRNRPPTARAVSNVLELCYRRLRNDPELRDLLGND